MAAEPDRAYSLKSAGTVVTAKQLAEPTEMNRVLRQLHLDVVNAAKRAGRRAFGDFTDQIWPFAGMSEEQRADHCAYYGVSVGRDGALVTTVVKTAPASGVTEPPGL